VWAWLTPENIPGTKACRVLRIPDNQDIISAVSGALLTLTEAENWEQDGAVTPLQMAEAMFTMWEDFLDEECPGGDVSRIGTIFGHMCMNPPEGSLALNGQIYAKATYPELWAVLHPNWEYSETHFKLPTMNAKFPVSTLPPEIGIYAMGHEDGDHTVGLTVEEMPAHTHTLKRPEVGVPSTTEYRLQQSFAKTNWDQTTGSAGDGDAHENRPPFVAFYYAVWYE